MAMLSLPEGDSAKAQVSEPDAETPSEPAASVEVTAVEAKPVILAKDGVHTIEYEKLVEAREAEKHWKQVAFDAQAQFEAQKATPAAPQKIETPEEEKGIDLGDYSEEGIAKGVSNKVAQEVAKATAAIEVKFEEKLNAVLAPMKAKQAQSAEEAHFSAIEAAHPDVNSIAQSEQFAKWIDAQPSFARDRYQDVIDKGTAEQVIEALNTYKAATVKQAAPKKVSAAAAAQAAIAKAQAAPPMSLSEIPAGSNAVTDETAAMLDMSSNGLMSKFDGKSQEQIMALMNRVL